MPDGSVAVLFASTSTPAVALELSRATWKADGTSPVKVAVYRGGKSKAIGPALLLWNAQ